MSYISIFEKFESLDLIDLGSNSINTCIKFLPIPSNIWPIPTNIVLYMANSY